MKSGICVNRRASAVSNPEREDQPQMNADKRRWEKKWMPRIDTDAGGDVPPAGNWDLPQSIKGRGNEVHD